MRAPILVGLALAGLSLIPSAFAQTPVPLVRLSALATPPLRDVHVVRQQAVDVAPLALANAMNSQVLRLELFSDVSLVAHRTGLATASRGTSWAGVLEGYPDSSVVFASVDDEFVAHVYTPFGFFRIQRIDGAYVVQQVEARRQEDDAIYSRDNAPAPAGTQTRDAGQRIGALALPEDSGEVIDLMVLFTKRAIDGFGSEARALATIELLVTETNEALQNSHIPSRLRLVHTATIEYEESGDSSADLIRLRGRNDGFLDDVHALRDLYAADLVTLITEKFEGTVEGRAYVSSPRSGNDTAFSVVQRSGTEDQTTFAHEIGHNLGFTHDWYVTSSPGAFTYSKGYVSTRGRFLDIMAYWDLCVDVRIRCAQLLFYSNSALSRDGNPEGVAPGTNVDCPTGNRQQVECDADNAATMSIMAPIVARFRNSHTGLRSRLILPGGFIDSDDGWFRLSYGRDGDLTLVDTHDRRVLWATNTSGTAPGQVRMESTGNLIVVDAAGVTRWASNTAGSPNAYVVVQGDGNVVIYDIEGRPIWSAR